jgi:hypothetical protein
MDPETGALVDPNDGKPPSNPAPSAVTAQPEGEPEMGAKKKRKERHSVDEALREDYALRALLGTKGEQWKIAEESGASASAVSKWVVLYRAKYPRWARGETHEAAKAAAKKAPPSSAAVSAPSGTRTLEVVSREYGEAVARVKALKAEMRALLGDD